jgi:hypothetical protein
MRKPAERSSRCGSRLQAQRSGGRRQFLKFGCPADEQLSRAARFRAETTFLKGATSCWGPGLTRSLAANQRLQTKNREMVANTHNSTPAIAHDTPTDANVRIGAAQAGTGKPLIGPHSEEMERTLRAGPAPFRVWVLGRIGFALSYHSSFVTITNAPTECGHGGASGLLPPWLAGARRARIRPRVRGR